MQDGFRPPAFDEAANALAPVLHNLSGKIVAIDGYPGVGKTTLGRFLAWRFNVSLITETDLLLIEGQGRLVHRNDDIARIITYQLGIPSPVIVEGCGVLRLLSQVNRSSDFLVYVTSKDAPGVDRNFATDLAKYDAEFSPQQRANITIELSNGQFVLALDFCENVENKGL